MVSVKETAMKRKCLPFLEREKSQITAARAIARSFGENPATRLELSTPGGGENVLLGKRFERFGLWSAETLPFMS